MSKVLEDLIAAFAGESQASSKYMAYARKADEEGYPQAAKLFRAAAKAENLQDAINGENYEVVTMYPPFIADAEAEGAKRAKTSFNWAWQVEKVHEELFRGELATLDQERESYDYYVCPVCGHTHPRCAPDRCPVCGAPGSRFEKIS